MIDTRQLRYFVAVAEQLHFGRAADGLHVAQSALSAQVRGLEDHLGVRLINRGKRAAVSLTQAGELFLDEARLSLRQIERTERVGKLAARGQLGRVNIGYVASAAISGLLSRSLATFRIAHPLVDVGLMSLDTPNQIHGLAEGLIDVGLVRSRPAYPDGIAAVEIDSDPLLLAMSDLHPLAKKEALRAADVTDQRYLVPQLNENVGFASFLAALGRYAGEQIDDMCVVPDFISALTLAAAGYGIVLIPSSFRHFRIPGVVMRDISDFTASASIDLIWRKENQNRAAFALTELMRSAA